MVGKNFTPSSRCFFGALTRIHISSHNQVFRAIVGTALVHIYIGYFVTFRVLSSRRTHICGSVCGCQIEKNANLLSRLAFLLIHGGGGHTAALTGSSPEVSDCDSRTGYEHRKTSLRLISYPRIPRIAAHSRTEDKHCIWAPHTSAWQQHLNLAQRPCWRKNDGVHDARTGSPGRQSCCPAFRRFSAETPRRSKAIHSLKEEAQFPSGCDE